jgi:hypothetical protein
MISRCVQILDALALKEAQEAVARARQPRIVHYPGSTHPAVHVDSPPQYKVLSPKKAPAHATSVARKPPATSAMLPNQLAQKVTQMTQAAMTKPARAAAETMPTQPSKEPPAAAPVVTRMQTHDRSGAPFIIVGDQSGVRWQQAGQAAAGSKYGSVGAVAPTVGNIVTPVSVFDNSHFTAGLGGNDSNNNLIVISVPLETGSPEESFVEEEQPVLRTRQGQGRSDNGVSVLEPNTFFNVSSISAPARSANAAVSYSDNFHVMCGQGVSHMSRAVVRMSSVVTAVGHSVGSTAGSTEQQEPTSSADTGATELFPNRNVPFVSRVMGEDPKLPQVPPPMQAPAFPVVKRQPEPEPSQAPQPQADHTSTSNELLAWLPMAMLGQQEAMKTNQALIFNMLEQQQQQQGLLQQQLELQAEMMKQREREAQALMQQQQLQQAQLQAEAENSPRAEDIALALAGAINSLAEQAQVNAPPPQLAAPPTDSAALEEKLASEIKHRVNEGVVAGVRDALAIIATNTIAPTPAPVPAPAPPAPKPVPEAPASRIPKESAMFTGLLNARGTGKGHTHNINVGRPDVHRDDVALKTAAVDAFKQAVDADTATSKRVIREIHDAHGDLFDDEDEDANLSVSVESTDYVSATTRYGHPATSDRRRAGSRSRTTNRRHVGDKYEPLIEDDADDQVEHWFVDEALFSSKQRQKQQQRAPTAANRLKSEMFTKTFGTHDRRVHKDEDDSVGAYENPYEQTHTLRLQRAHTGKGNVNYDVTKKLMVPKPLVSMMLPNTATMNTIDQFSSSRARGNNNLMSISIASTDSATGQESESADAVTSRKADRQKFKEYEEHYAHDDSFVDDLEEEDEDAVDVAAAGAGGGSRRRAHTGRHAGRHARSRYSGDEGSVNEDDASYTTPSRRPQKRDAPRHPGLVSVTRLAGFQDVSYEEDQSYNSSDAASAYESMSTSISSSSTSVDFSNLARAVLDDSLLTETTYSSSGHSSNSSNSRDRNIPHAAGDNELDAADDREDEDDLSVDICTPFERAQTDNANNNRTGLRLWRPAAGNLVGKWK